MNTFSKFLAYNLLSVTVVVSIASADSSAPQSSPGHRGYGSHKNCPWNCKMAGLAPDKCREWKSGGICYIEDFSKPARQGDGPSSQPLAAAMPQTQAPSKGEQAQTVPPLAARANSDYEVCRSLNPENLGRPTIEIADVKKAGGGFFSDSYRISGTIEGNCLIEAGVFESGKKIEDIPISTAREFRRFNFEVKAGARQGREIRAYNINGQRDSFVFSGPQ